MVDYFELVLCEHASGRRSESRKSHVGVPGLFFVGHIWLGCVLWLYQDLDIWRL